MTIKNSSKSNKGSFWLILFGLLFTAFGLAMGGWLVSGIFTSLKMQSWEETPAKIVNTNQKGINNSPERNKGVEYEYKFHDQQYTGTRISIFDQDSDFRENPLSYCYLNINNKTNKSFHCYGNPERPGEAIIYRNIPWRMVVFFIQFFLLFGGIGFGILAFIIQNHRKNRRQNAARAAHPEALWMCKPDWASGKINSSTAISMKLLAAAAYIWNVITFQLWFVLPSEILVKGNLNALLGLIVPAIGIFLLVCAFVSMMRWRKYGRSVFEMASVPGLIGGQLAGVVHCSAKIKPEDAFHVKLNCVKCVMTNSGSDSHVSRSILWQDEQLIPCDLLQNEANQSAIPILFQIPYDCQQTDEKDSDNQILWELEVTGKTPGLDYRATFDVPMFKTSESDPNFEIDPELITKYTAPEDPERDIRNAGIVQTTSPNGNGCRFIFPMAREPGRALGFTIGCLHCLVTPIILLYIEFGWITAIFSIIFGLTGLFLFLVVIDLWFYSSIIDVSQQGMEIRGGLFGFGRIQTLTPSEISEIKASSRMHSDNSIWFDIDIVRYSGKRITIGKRLPGKRLASYVIRQIEQAMAGESYLS